MFLIEANRISGFLETFYLLLEVLFIPIYVIDVSSKTEKAKRVHIQLIPLLIMNSNCFAEDKGIVTSGVTMPQQPRLCPGAMLGW